MKRTLLLFLLLSIAALHAHAQTPGFYFGAFHCTIDDPQDSLLLRSNEIRMWHYAVDTGLMAFDNPAFDIEFKVRMSRAQLKGIFEDSFPVHSFTSDYRMIVMANRGFDTCYLMSCSPLLAKPPGQKTIPGMPVSDKTYGLLAPLSAYPPGKLMQVAAPVYKEQLAKRMKGQLTGDTIFRTVYFTCDSNEYLPQAPYHHLLSRYKDCMLAGMLRTYTDKELQHVKTKHELEMSFVAWDSTNQVEDPNHPGTFVFAPIKFEGQSKSLVIYEKWVPVAVPKLTGKYGWPPAPLLAYKREIVSYGLLLTNGKTIWFSQTQADAQLKKDGFNLFPYEECFRAERFTTFGTELYRRY